jgi:hypothetical protein
VFFGSEIFFSFLFVLFNVGLNQKLVCNIVDHFNHSILSILIIFVVLHDQNTKHLNPYHLNQSKNQNHTKY